MDISSAVYIFLEGKKRIDKFGPIDGHPMIAGYNIVKFLQERLQKDEMDAFAEIVRGCHFIKYDETKVDARTDKSSDILGLLWRRGAMNLYDSEDFADVVDYIYQIDLDNRYFRMLGTSEKTYTFDELRTLTDKDFMADAEAFA